MEVDPSEHQQEAVRRAFTLVNAVSAEDHQFRAVLWQENLAWLEVDPATRVPALLSALSTLAYGALLCATEEPRQLPDIIEVLRPALLRYMGTTGDTF